MKIKLGTVTVGLLTAFACARPTQEEVEDFEDAVAGFQAAVILEDLGPTETIDTCRIEGGWVVTVATEVGWRAVQLDENGEVVLTWDVPSGEGVVGAVSDCEVRDGRLDFFEFGTSGSGLRSLGLGDPQVSFAFVLGGEAVVDGRVDDDGVTRFTDIFGGRIRRLTDEPYDPVADEQVIRYVSPVFGTATLGGGRYLAATLEPDRKTESVMLYIDGDTVEEIGSAGRAPGNITCAGLFCLTPSYGDSTVTVTRVDDQGATNVAVHDAPAGPVQVRYDKVLGFVVVGFDDARAEAWQLDDEGQIAERTELPLDAQESLSDMAVLDDGIGVAAGDGRLFTFRF